MGIIRTGSPFRGRHRRGRCYSKGGTKGGTKGELIKAAIEQNKKQLEFCRGYGKTIAAHIAFLASKEREVAAIKLRTSFLRQAELDDVEFALRQVLDKKEKDKDKKDKEKKDTEKKDTEKKDKEKKDKEKEDNEDIPVDYERDLEDGEINF